MGGVTSDILRLLALALFASVTAQAAVINYHSWRNRRTGPIRLPQLLAWHIHAVTVYAVGMHALLMTLTLDRLGDEGTRYPLALVGLIFLGAVGNAAMVIIGHITAARRRMQAAAQ